MSHYWRHGAVPFVEIRNVEDGRAFSHAAHAHETFSIGAIVAGRSTYRNGATQCEINAGDLVLINPRAVHACNPVHGQPWAYRMFYVDSEWLGSLQSGHISEFVPLAQTHVNDQCLFAGIESLYRRLTDPRTPVAALETAAQDFFSRLLDSVDKQPAPPEHERPEHRKLATAARFIREHCSQPLSLDEIGHTAQLSASYLIRAFKARYGLTPHGYLVDCRIQLARARLRRGEAIAQVAAELGFADQAHLQRVFKLRLAATPGQYRG